MISAEEQQSIISNSLAVKADNDQVIRIYENKDNLQGALPAYYENPEMLEVNQKINQLKQKTDYKNYNESFQRGALADPSLYAVANTEPLVFDTIANNMQARRDTEVEREAEESVWNIAAGNIATGYKSGQLGFEIGQLYDELRQTEDENQRVKIQKSIDEKQNEISQLKIQEDSWLQSFGQVLGSISETTPEMAAIGAGGALSSLPSPYTKVAGGALTALGTYGIYRDVASSEAGSMYQQLLQYPNLTENQRNELADSVGTINGWIEVAGTSLGLGHLAKFTGKSAAAMAFKKKLNDAIVKTAVKNGTFNFATKPTFIARFIKGLAGVIAETTSETLEEVMQNAITGGVEKQAKEGVKETGVISTLGSGAKYLATEEGRQQALQTIKGVAPGIGILSGLTRGTIGTVGLVEDRISIKAEAPKNALQVAQEGQQSLNQAEAIMQAKKDSELLKKSPRAFNDVVAGIAKDGNSIVVMDVDDAIELTEKAQTSEEMRRAVEALDLQTKIEDAQNGDGNVIIPFESANDILFNPEDETLFQTVKDKISFDVNTMSKKKSDEFVKDLLTTSPQASQALQNKESQLSKYVEELKKNMPESEAVANGILLQQMVNNARTFRGENISEEEFFEQERLKIAAEKRRQLDKRIAEANKPKKGLLGGKKLHGKKVKTKDVPMDKIQGEDIVAGVGAEDMSSQNVVLFEDKQGNYEVVSDNGAVANARINNAENLENPITVSEKDGYTVEDAQQLAEDMKSATQLELFQRTWHGGPKLEGNKFSLKYAGKQTGMQHGYGVYTALSPDTAANYRSMIDPNFTYKGKHIAEFMRSLEEKGDYDKYSILEDFAMKQTKETMNKEDYSDDTWNWFEKDFLPKVKSKGKLYEVDTPDDFELIDEQKRLSEQPENVRFAILAAIEKIDGYGITAKAIERDAFGGDLYVELGKDVFFDKHGYEGGSKEVMQAASEFLDKIGIKGIKYDGGEEGTNFVIFNPENVKIMQSFYQSTSDVIAGSYNAVQNLITLSQSSNPTTFSHEAGHWFTVSLFDDFDRGLLTDYWKKQAQTAAEWAGAKIVDGQITWKNDKAKVKGLEKLAEGFVTYLKEGKAPTPTLTKLYDYFRNLFVQTYRMIKGLPDIKLNKEISDFFDRMVATEEEVNALREQERYGSLEKPADMTQELYDKYLSMQRAAHRETVNGVITQTAKIAEKKTTQEYKDMYNTLLKENIDELMKEPEYQAVAMAETQKINPASLEGVLPDGVKLDKKYLSDKGLPADIVLGQGGFNSVAEMVNRLNENRNATQAAMQATDQQMNDWLEQNYPDLLRSDPKVASKNVNTIKLQVTEALMLKGIPTTESGLYYKRLVDNAERAIGNMRMPQLTNIERMFQQLNTVSERYRIAELKGDKNTMSAERWRAAVLNYSIMRGLQAKQLQARFNRHFAKRYNKRPTPVQLKKIEGNVWDMMTAALNNFGFTARKPANPQQLSGRINEYMAELLEDNFDVADDITDNSAFMDNLEGVNPRTMTYNDFLIMSSEMERLEHRSKNVREGILSENMQSIDDAAKSIQDHFIKTGAKRWNENDVFKNMILGYSSMRETILSRMFPKRVNLEYILPLQEGIAKKNNWVNKTMKRFETILKPIIVKNKKELIINDKTFDYQTLMIMMLNSGTRHNRESLLATLRDKRGINLTEEEYVDILRQAPAEMRTVANQIWQIMQEDTPEMLRVNRRLNGQEIRLEDPTPINFNDGGEELTGGYYPAFKRTLDSNIDVTDNSVHNLSNILSQTGMIKERMKGANNDIYLDYNALSNWVYQKGSLLHLALPFNNVQNLLKNPAIRETIGEGAYRALTNGWLKYMLTPDRVNKVLGELDSLSSAGILGGGIRKGIIQATGWITSLRYVNPMYILKSLTSVLTNPKTLWNLTDVARSKSNYMKGRFDNPAAYIADIRQYGELGAKAKSWVDLAKDLSLWTVTRGDALASVITWNAAYEQSIVEGLSDKDATLQADSVVRRTQGDTSAGSRPPMLQGNERFFTKFASYWVGVYSGLASDLYYGTKKEKLFGITASVALAGILEPIISAFMQSAYTWLISGDDRKEKWKKQGINTMDDYIKYEVGDNVKTSLSSAILPQFGLGYSMAKYDEQQKLYGGEFLPLTFLLSTGSLGIDAKKYLMSDNDKEKDKILNRMSKNAKKAVGWSNPIEFEAIYDILGKAVGGGK